MDAYKNTKLLDYTLRFKSKSFLYCKMHIKLNMKMGTRNSMA